MLPRPRLTSESLQSKQIPKKKPVRRALAGLCGRRRSRVSVRAARRQPGWTDWLVTGGGGASRAQPATQGHSVTPPFWVQAGGPPGGRRLRALCFPSGPACWSHHEDSHWAERALPQNVPELRPLCAVEARRDDAPPVPLVWVRRGLGPV